MDKRRVSFMRGLLAASPGHSKSAHQLGPTLTAQSADPTRLSSGEQEEEREARDTSASRPSAEARAHTSRARLPASSSLRVTSTM